MIKKIFIRLYIPVILGIAVSSCVFAGMLSNPTTIYYVGDTYTVSSDFEVYYDENDVQKPYKVIGRMTNDLYAYDADDLKNRMIEKAKQVGGDGIIFTDITVKRPHDAGDRLLFKANVIKYQ